MSVWMVSCAVGSLRDLEAALDHFSFVDIAVHSMKLSLGIAANESTDRLVDMLVPFRARTSSVHMQNNYTSQAKDGAPLLKQDLALMSALDIRIGVLHLRPPVDTKDLEDQLQLVCSLASGSEAKIAIENLPDRRNRAQGFAWIRNPVSISEYLEANEWPCIELCLDTSHALCRNLRRWNTPAVRKHVVAIHLSDGIPGQDAHLALSPRTNQCMLKETSNLIEFSDQDGVVILENRDVSEAIKSLQYLLHIGVCSGDGVWRHQRREGDRACTSSDFGWAHGSQL